MWCLFPMLECYIIKVRSLMKNRRRLGSVKEVSDKIEKRRRQDSNSNVLSAFSELDYSIELTEVAL